MQIVVLPELPPNARYVHHHHSCSVWGTFGWVLGSQGVSIKDYKHFIFLTSAVRGPFLPPYLKARNPRGPACSPETSREAFVRIAPTVVSSNGMAVSLRGDAPVLQFNLRGSRTTSSKGMHALRCLDATMTATETRPPIRSY